MTDEQKNIPLRELSPLPETPATEHPAPLDANREQLPSPEAGIVMQKESFLDETIESLKQTLRISRKPRQKQIPQVRDDLTVKIEHIMQAGLEDAYRELPVVKQQEFKIKGEETAQAIRGLMKSTHVKIKKIFKLLMEWLKLLPGINRFYLEQEAKIKADRIVGLKNFDTRR